MQRSARVVSMVMVKETKHETRKKKGRTRDRSVRLQLRPSSAIRTSVGPLSPVGRAAYRIEGRAAVKMDEDEAEGPSR